MRAAVVCLLLAAGCSTAAFQNRPSLSTTPEETTAVAGQEDHVLVGTAIDVYGSWSDGACHHHHYGPSLGERFDNAIAKEPHAESPEEDYVTCGTRPSHVAVACAPSCDVVRIDRDAGGVSVHRFEATPRAPGAFVVHATVTRDDTGEVSTRDDHYLAVLPDELVLVCTPGGPCGPEGVPAARPLVYPSVVLAGRTSYPSALTVNDRPLHGSDPISLAELYPAARAGSGIAPGRYLVTLRYGDRVESFQLVAR